MVQWLRSSPCTPGDPIWAPVLSRQPRFPSSSLPVAQENRPKALGPCTRVGDLEEAPGSWFQIGSALSVVAPCGVNQQSEELPFCLYSSMYVSISSNKNRSWAQCGGAVVKVLALHARDPIWAPVLTQQPRFPSSSLPVARESSRGQPKALGPCTGNSPVQQGL